MAGRSSVCALAANLQDGLVREQSQLRDSNSTLFVLAAIRQAFSGCFALTLGSHDQNHRAIEMKYYACCIEAQTKFVRVTKAVLTLKSAP